MDKHLTVYQHLTGYLNSLSGQNFSEHTIRAYRSDIRMFLDWMHSQDLTVTYPCHVQKEHVVGYLSSLSQQSISGVTRARKLAAIRAFCDYLVTERVLTCSPAQEVKMPKKEKRTWVFLRVDEYLRLLTAAGGQPRDFAILQLFLQTGIRVSELVGLRVNDVDMTNGTITIYAKNKKERLIYLERKGLQALKSYLSVRPPSLDTRLFLNYEGQGISTRGVSDIVEKYRKQAGIQKKISCHSLRHTFATYKASMGVTAFQLKEMLGHDSINTSLLYVHMAMTDPKKLMQQTSL